MNKVWATKNKHGFTIVELLVVIVVIGILVGITIVSYGAIQQRARDSERSSDVTQLKIALEKYHADNGQYPAVCTVDNAACVISLLSGPLAPYLSNIPHDPKYSADSGSDYRYVRTPLSLDGYGIRVVYEAKPMCMTGQNVSAGWWSSIPIC